MAKDRMALLDTPTQTRVPTPRRDPVPDFREDFSARPVPPRRAAQFETPEEDAPRPRGLRLKIRTGFPRSAAGRVIVILLGMTALGAIAYGLHTAEVAVLHDARLTIPASSAVEISGNNHLTRAQLLSVFGEDVDRNLLSVPLAGRRAELEALPWVEHATVMRLLPNRLRIAIRERTPVAFVRQGSQIGLVDAHGVLLDLSPELAADHAYSFPVVTGIASTDPASVRLARMKLYLRFTGELDAGTDKVSKKLSEIDLTDPEDIKALIPDGSTDVLVHFGDTDFLPRYQRYLQNLSEWKTKYPKLASVDMRYEHDVVLEMSPGATVPIATAPEPAAAPARATAPPKPAKKPAKKLAKKPAKKPEDKLRAKPAATPTAARAGHLQEAFDVKVKAKPTKAGPR